MYFPVKPYMRFMYWTHLSCAIILVFSFIAFACLTYRDMTLNHRVVNLYREAACTVVGLHKVEADEGSIGGIQIEYEYSVNGRTYRARRLDAMNYVVRPHEAPAHGAQAACWYDPDDPSQAVLRRTGTAAPYFFIPMSILSLVLGVGFFVNLPRSAAACRKLY